MVVISDGSGDGSYGEGDGDGAGYGYGYGDGDGCGGGDGGYGGYGADDGDGYGSDDGDGAGAAGAALAFWRSGRDGEPVNGGRGTRARVGLVEEVAGPLAVCTPSGLHASLAPWLYRGDRLWVVALHGDLARDGDKLAALRREILAEVVPNPFAAAVGS